MSRILVADAQLSLLRSLRQGLEEEGYTVVIAVNGDDAHRRARVGDIDAIVLDLMLPGRDGLSVLRALRQEGFTRPIIIVTARDSVEDRVLGLDSGADDYLAKPFAFAELTARIRSLLRRSEEVAPTCLLVGDMRIDALHRRVSRDGKEIELTNLQFKLLEYLAQHVNQPVSRDTILREVWQDGSGLPSNVIEVCVNHLRRKLERDDRPHFLETIRGFGYMLRAQDRRIH